MNTNMNEKKTHEATCQPYNKWENENTRTLYTNMKNDSKQIVETSVF